MGGSDPWSVRRAAIWAIAFMATGVLGDEKLVSSGFYNCESSNDIIVSSIDFEYSNADKSITFDMQGTSTKERNVTAKLTIKAVGEDVYSGGFSPCGPATFFPSLCPVPLGHFQTNGANAISSQLAGRIPALAFQVPDIAAQARLELTPVDNDNILGCVEFQVINGKTVDVPGLPYVAAGIAAGALAVGGASAMSAAASGAGAAGGAGSSAGSAAMNPTFGEVFGVFHGFALNGMMSAQLPQVYRRFSKNFAFSTGLIPWTDMELGIDNFRAKTGGNVTKDSVQLLQKTTLVYPDGTITNGDGSLSKRSFQSGYLAVRDVDNSTNPADTSIRTAVQGIRSFANSLAVPASNTFMTVLEIVTIALATIIVCILLLKVILEVCAFYGKFPNFLPNFRKHYRSFIARTITNLILLLYGVWVLYCVFQFTHGDSWAAQLLAAVTLGIFTSVLAFFSWKIWSIANELKAREGDAGSLYDDKQYWEKYSLFYESYKKGCWWLFIPAIIYLFVKGTVMAATDGDGMTQTALSLVVEGLFFILLLWSRPYERRSGNIINITIQAVRVLSVALVLVCVEEFGIAQTTQTVAGIVLVVLQSALAGALAILVIANAAISFFKGNPHEKRREMQKSHRDTLTSLHPRNSLLKMHHESGAGTESFPFADLSSVKGGDYGPPRCDSSHGSFIATSTRHSGPGYPPGSSHDMGGATYGSENQSRERLVG
ncbi:hypothetical protein GGS21DRAFT_541183 [Xylaria nigripes]|nr:hypothetical protein GGS21DRAFT_541183 [Xylaria nigripes]